MALTLSPTPTVTREILEAIDDEIQAIRKRNKRNPIRFINLESMGIMGEHSYYFRAVFYSDEDADSFHLPEGIEIRVRYSNWDFILKEREERYIYGTLLLNDPNKGQVIFATKEHFYIRPESYFFIEPLDDQLWISVKERISCLGEISEISQQILNGRIANNDFPVISPDPERSLNDSQNIALAKCLQNKITYIWGPPGTGKTHTLAYIIKKLSEQKKKILACAISNVAIDQLALRVVNQFQGTWGKYELLRFGYPKLKAVRDKDILFPNQNKIKSLRQEINSLEKELKHVVINDQKAIKQEKLKKLNQNLRKLTVEPIGLSNIIFTTVTQVILEDKFWEGRFDVLVIDEASMLSVSYLAALGQIPKDKIIIAGDFKQLSPIAQSSTPLSEKWLHKDPFEIAKMNTPVNHPNLAMLKTQRRMHDEIGDLISKNFYFNELRTEVSLQNKEAAEAPPVPNCPLVWYHVPSSKKFEVQKTDRGSRYNLGSSDEVADLARRFARRPIIKSIGIITPYRAQAKRIEGLVKELKLPKHHHAKIKIGTVHAFQGDESDVIIFDIVDNESSNFGKLLTGPTGQRLLNVAFSRAKGKLIIIGDAHYCTNMENSDLAIAGIFSDCLRSGKIFLPLAGVII